MTASAVSAARSLVDLFTRRAAESPDAIAIVDVDDARLTRAQLRDAADRVAAQLAVVGVRPGDLVGLLVDRDANTVISLLGILASGAAYVPLDPTYPVERLRFIAADAAIEVVVGRTATAERAGLAGYRLVEPDGTSADPVPRRSGFPGPGPEDTAYVLYTSGSTGTPKGCVITHGNVLSLLGSAVSCFDLTATDRWALYHSLCFDFSVWELWCALATGAAAVVVPWSTALSADEFVRFLEHHRITVLNQVPSVFRYFVQALAERDEPRLELRYLFLGGERVPLGAVRDFVAAAGPVPPIVVNMYGLTENTVVATTKTLDAPTLASGVASPIGRPLPHLNAHVLTEPGRPAADGEAGELWLTGDSLSSGYLNRAELTAERFVMLPAAGGGPGVRAYRTGDIVRRSPAGDLDYVGRVDDQVKLRGQRIELGEIERALATHPAVSECAVCVVETPVGDELGGCVVCTAEADHALVDSIMTLLRRSLPEHMVPRDYVAVDRLPLTPGGKLDRDAIRGYFR